MSSQVLCVFIPEMHQDHGLCNAELKLYIHVVSNIVKFVPIAEM